MLILKLGPAISLRKSYKNDEDNYCNKDESYRSNNVRSGCDYCDNFNK